MWRFRPKALCAAHVRLILRLNMKAHLFAIPLLLGTITFIHTQTWRHIRPLMAFGFFLGLTGPAGAANDVSAFYIGDRVVTTGVSAVYAAPPTAAPFSGNQPANISGTIADGPVRVGDIWWWKVAFESGPSGWIAERQLRNAAGQKGAPREAEAVENPPPGGFVTVTPANGSTVTSSQVVVQGTVTNDVFAPWLLS